MFDMFDRTEGSRQPAWCGGVVSECTGASPSGGTSPDAAW
jgi:hypothetical protein